MPWKLREYECEDCGKLTRRNRKSNDPHICVECGKERRYLGRLARAHPPAPPPDPPASCAF
jgi:ribosomal protein L37AE/L43A